MKVGILSTNDDIRTQRFYHGTRAELKQGDLIEPSNPANLGERDMITTYVKLTPIWMQPFGRQNSRPAKVPAESTSWSRSARSKTPPA